MTTQHTKSFPQLYIGHVLHRLYDPFIEVKAAEVFNAFNNTKLSMSHSLHDNVSNRLIIDHCETWSP